MVGLDGGRGSSLFLEGLMAIDDRLDCPCTHDSPRSDGVWPSFASGWALEPGSDSEADQEAIPLARMIDVVVVQRLMDDFHRLTNIPMAVLDLQGRVLVGVGWQRICTDFHRRHRPTCEHCIESDTTLTAGTPLGEFKLYKCLNGMWDVATPLYVGGEHVGNVFTGQFFFDDEEVDRVAFRRRAREHGFDEQEYLAALAEVPRFSREEIDAALSFLLNLARTLSNLGCCNLRLSTAMRERESLIRSLQDSKALLDAAEGMAHLGSWELHVPTGKLTWSREVYRIFGLPTSFAASYEAFLEVVHPEDRVLVDEAYRGSLERGEASYRIRHRVVRGDAGEVRWVDEECRHERDEAGVPIRSVGTVLDVTDRVTYEAELRASHAAVVDRDRHKDEFLAMLSHELRNPLMPMRLSVDIMKEVEPGSARDLRARAVLDRQIDHMSRLVDDLLDATRVARGKIELRWEVVDVDELARTVAEDHLQVFMARGLELVLERAPGPVRVFGDRARLAQVLGNLLHNAVKFCETGGATVSVGRREGGWVLLRVRDTGPGIDREVLPHLFERFAQGPVRIDRVKGGLGLGLALVKSVVELHGGRVEVGSPGIGTEMQVWLREVPEGDASLVPRGQDAR